MISIGSEPTPTVLNFTARKGNKSLSVPLISAHMCPTCNNLIQATFATKELIDTYPFEEVNILKLEGENSGTVSEILPNDKHKQKKSCYNVIYDSTLGYQKITLKNHILKMSAGVSKRADGSHVLETGPVPCPYLGIYSHSEELATKDFLLFSGWDQEVFKKFNKDKPIPPLEFFAPIGKENTLFKRVPGIGKGTDVILLRRKNIVYGCYYLFEKQLNEYLNK